MYEELKTTFNKIYANLPLGLRNEIIYVDPKYGPCTWNVLWLEVSQDTSVAAVALGFLKAMKII